ncbi:helix-turn-helix domain-containing protein [Mucilaginibacter antarcticus]|uniref:Helix-turn-helix domain-containing protein n=1 Tax=Mucilaginibacter antarcticus TaxID=1855725 RepID=A0ABW5XNT1_9SPHI
MNDNEILTNGGPAESFIQIGDRIRALRMNQSRTLQEIADASDLSKSMISKIENNKAVPSVAALVKIAKTLGTNISNLLEQDGRARTVFTAQEEAMRNITLTEKGYAVYPYAANFHEKLMQPFLFTARRDDVVPHRVSHDGEEFVFVIDGEMKMTVGEIEYVLKKGDSLYFNALQKHGIMPVAEAVTYLDIFV